MDLLQVVVAAFGGSVAALALAGFLGKALVGQWLARELEDQRARLKLEGDTLVESLRARLQHDARVDDRQFELDQVMRRYQGPLMHAVHDLQSRLFNIVDRHFLATYLNAGTPAQRHYALHNTAFLIAQYCGWTEIIRQQVQFIEFADIARTRRLSELRDQVYGLWQRAGYGDALTIWAGEQRAIGELMIEPRGDALACMGYARFLKAFQPGQEPLIDRLREGLAACAAPSASLDRLLAVQHKLIDMLDLLDPDALRFPAATRTKA